MKRKNKIYIPKGANGLIASNPLALNASMDKMAGLGSSLQSSQLPTKLTNPLGAAKAPGGVKGPGLGAINIAQAVQGVGSLIGSFTGKSNATTSAQATSESIGSVFSGASTGAQIGAAAGPIGAIVGGAGGAILGGIGKSGIKASMTSFTDFDEGTYSTGMKGLFGGNKKLRRRRQAIKNNAYANRAAVQGTDNLQSEFNEDYGDMDTDTFAYGGMIPSSLAYLDDGEMIKTPDGEVNKIPEQGKPTDSNLLQIPTGTTVLSDSLIVPGTKQTFAKLGESLMSKTKTYSNDRFAQNSKKLNDMNNSMIHNQLFEAQEALKKRKGIKPSSKAMSFDKGGITTKSTKVTEKPVFTIPEDYLKQSSPEIGLDFKITPKQYTSTISNTATSPVAKKTISPKFGSTSWLNGLGDKVSGLFTGAATLAPIFDNLFTGRADAVRDVQNPYAGSINDTMSNRRFDIRPAIADLTRNRAINRYNMSQINTSTGANMAYGIQSAVNTDRAIEEMRSQENNYNNQYRADYANTMNNLGQQYVQATNLAQDLNARNQANARNIRRTGLSQMSQLAQQNLLTKNMMSRDDAMLQLYAPFLNSGFSSDILDSVYNNYVKGGNRYGR